MTHEAEASGARTERFVATEVVDRTLLVTLDWPERLNAVDTDMIDRLIDVCDMADADDAIRAMVVTGRGRAFCAGADLSGGSDNLRLGADDSRHRDGGGRLALRLFGLHKPTIAAVNGPSVGFGAALTLPMDVRIASTEARFGFVYTRRGIVPEGCSSWFLPRVVGISRAVEWVVSGRVFAADEALEAGLVRSVVEPDQLLPAAMRVAEQIAVHTAPVPVALARQMLWRMLGASDPHEAHLLESSLVPLLGRAPDAVEGVASFRERRNPAFTGSVANDMPSDLPWATTTTERMA